MTEIPLTLIVTVGALAFALFEFYEARKTRASHQTHPDLSEGQDLDRLFSLKRNTLFWLIAVLPMAWLGAIWFIDEVIAGIVLVWVAGRLIFVRRDVADRKAYWLGLWLQFLAFSALVLSSYVIFVVSRAYFG